jgi:flavin-dependent dehydrogenase
LHAAIVALVFSENELLRDRFEQMTLQWEKPLSVSQLGFRATAPFVGDIALAGDAAGMIAPLCGDGMSMALMSGIFLGRLAAEYLDGRLSSDDFRAVYTRGWKSGFGRRMFLGRLTHRLLTNPMSARLAVSVGRVAPSTLDWLTRQTRGYPAAFTTRP